MIIYDNIHGYITLSKLATSIIDTSIFQRLRNIHQTGILYLVFPSATHTRFEHSIGTYHLAILITNNLKKNNPDINITDELIELIGIAGLCHDLGHLLYSHLFDDLFLKKLPNYEELKKRTNNVTHENRSIYLLKYLVNKYNIELNNEQLKVICDIIYPEKSEYDNWNPKYQVGKWIFQIISNPVNSIDVDKFDYLVRDTNSVGLKFSFNSTRIMNDVKIINDNICYSLQSSEDIYHMFFIRYRLHRQIYNHKAVKAVEILIVKLLFELEKEIKISEFILDPEKMIQLVDSFIWYTNSNDKIKEIINNIYERKLPKLVYENISINNDIQNELNLKLEYDPNLYEIIKFSVGYVGGKSNNPLNNIYFYNLKTGLVITNNKSENFSLFLNQTFKEYFIRIYKIL